MSHENQECRGSQSPSAFFFTTERRFFISAFLIVWAYSILKPLRYTVLASTLGISTLPFLKISSSLLLGWYSIRSGLAVHLKSRLFLLSSLLCFALIPLYHFQNVYVQGTLFLILEIVPIITLSLLWSLMHSTFSSEQAQSFYPRVCLVGEIASIIAYATGIILNYSPDAPLLLAALSGIAYGVAWKYTANYTMVTPSLKKEPVLSDSLNLIALFLLLQVTSNCVKITSEYFFLRHLEHFYQHSSHAYSHFLYSFYLVKHIVSFIVLYGVALFPTNYSIFIAPVFALLISCMLLYSQSFACVALSFFIISSTFSSIYYPALMVLYKQISVPLRHMLQNQAPLYTKIAVWISAGFSVHLFPASIIIASALWLGILAKIEFIHPKKYVE